MSKHNPFPGVTKSESYTLLVFALDNSDWVINCATYPTESSARGIAEGIEARGEGRVRITKNETVSTTTVICDNR